MITIYIFAVRKRNQTKWYFRHHAFVSEGFNSYEDANTEAIRYRENYYTGL